MLGIASRALFVMYLFLTKTKIRFIVLSLTLLHKIKYHKMWLRNTTGMVVQSDTEIADACTNIIYLFFTTSTNVGMA